jgi:photosystem II stability/assembly factor-like uncharacterized protein
MKERLSLPESARIAAAASMLPLLVLLCLLSGEPASSAPTLLETVLYQEDFEDGQAQDWELGSGWAIIQDTAGNRVLRGEGPCAAVYLGDAWGDYTLKLRVKLIRGGIHLNYRVSLCLRYFIGFNERELYLCKDSSCETSSDLRVISEPHSLGRWYEVSITGSGGKIEIYVDGTLRLSYTDPDPLTYGRIALQAVKNSEVYVDDIEVSGKPSPTLGLQWVRTGGPLGGLGYDIRMRPDNPDIMYVTDAWSGVHISTDGGLTWRASNEGIATRAGPSGDAIPVFSLTIDPQDPDVIWCGTQNRRGIWKSTDGGKTWTRKDNGVVENEGITFRGFTVDPRSSNTVYAAAEISSYAWAGEDRWGREFDLTKGVVYKTTDGGERWTAIWRGDNLARYIWIDPRNSDALYVSTGIFDREAANSNAPADVPGGVGILKSTDGGRTWQVLNQANGLRNLYIGSLFMHPTNPDILLAGAGNNAYRASSGVYLSTDAGQTWRQVLETGSSPTTSVEFSSSDPRVAYAGTASAVYRSEDGGRTWRKATQGSIWGPPGIRAGVPIDFQVDPRAPNRLFANNYGGGNFLSTDGARTWSVASQGYTGAQLHGIAVDQTDATRAYVIGRTGPFRTLDDGSTWEGLNYEPATFAEWYAVVLDPRNPSAVMISDSSEGVILRSADGGEHWNMVFRHPQVGWTVSSDIHLRQGFKAIAFSPSNPDVVYAGMCYGCCVIRYEDKVWRSFGIQKSTDGGLSWSEANDINTADQSITTLAVDPHSDRIAYAGTVSKGVFKTANGGQTWQAMNQGLRVLVIRVLAIDPHNSQVMYVGAEGGAVSKSTDGGAHWQLSSSGMDPQAAIWDIAVDPTNPQVLYAADLRAGVYRSQDGAKTWVKINNGLRTRAVKALAISSDGKVLYAATEGEGVFRLDLAPAGGG